METLTLHSDRTSTRPILYLTSHPYFNSCLSRLSISSGATFYNALYEFWVNVVFAFELGGHVFTELEVIGLPDCWAHIALIAIVIQPTLRPIHPLFKMQLTK